MRWHILTGEYPPREGGVADYTALVAHGLVAAGDAVDVWTPHVEAHMDDAGVVVHGLPDHFGPRALAVLGRDLAASQPPHRILVQYVPHAFGWKGTNVPFCLWLRSQGHAPVWVMFHEVAFPIGRHQRLAENGLGIVTRGMATLVASAAERAFVSIPAWEPLVRQAAAASTPIEWMPVPSAIAVDSDEAAVAAVRARFADGRPLIGHFGTFGRLIRPLLIDAIPAVIREAQANVLLIGRGSDAMAEELGRRWPDLQPHIAGAGALDPPGVSHHVAACDAMLQPYPDGVSTRRTSVMVALAHGRPVVTTRGPLTEQLWGQTPGIVACPVGDTAALVQACAALAAPTPERAWNSAAARALYASQFDLRHTIAMLRAPDVAGGARRAS
ncbi:MAG: glycosyltransferase family 4 protein [Vicinamibacterales bacterium]